MYIKSQTIKKNILNLVVQLFEKYSSAVQQHGMQGLKVYMFTSFIAHNLKVCTRCGDFLHKISGLKLEERTAS